MQCNSGEKMNKNIKIVTNKRSDRFLVSDNLYTYFSISDNTNEYDGMWANGFHIFNSLFPNKKNAVITKKILLNDKIVTSFDNKIDLEYSLFKKGAGFVIDVKNKRLFGDNKKSYQFSLVINSKFQIIEKNIRHIILEYSSPDRDGFDHKKIYCIITPINNAEISSTKKDNNTLLFIIKPSSNNKENGIYFFTSPDVDILKKQSENNLIKLPVFRKQNIQNCMLPFKYTNFSTENSLFNNALFWAMYSGSTFVMHKGNNIGIWAGYPWFDNNWGRDTFISLPGISLVSGRYEEAWHIIESFSKFQDTNKKSKNYGKIPNLIISPKEILYNTSDATPLFLRELYEYFLYTGDFKAIFSIWDVMERAVEGVYLNKKDSSNFITQEDGDDWMDAKMDGKISFSPRGDRAIEVQALWYTALHAVANIGKAIVKYAKSRKPIPDNLNIDKINKNAKLYREEARKLKVSFNNIFVTTAEPYLFDHINKDGSPDTSIRPNVILSLFYSTLTDIPPLVGRDVGIKLIKFLLPRIIYEHGVASLDKNDELFHPMHISDMYHKDAAYHNGVIWLWLSGPLINLMTQYGMYDLAYKHTENLANQLINIDTLGSLSEIVSPYLKDDKTIISSGAYSQAWSVAEFCRSAYQDYFGIRPDVGNRTLYLYPSVPIKLGVVSTNIRFGLNETLFIYLRVNKRTSRPDFFEAKSLEINEPITLILRIPLGYTKKESKYKYKFVYFKVLFNSKNDIFRIGFKSAKADFVNLSQIAAIEDCEIQSIETESEIFDEALDEDIKFALPITETEALSIKALEEKDFLTKKLVKDK